MSNYITRWQARAGVRAADDVSLGDNLSVIPGGPEQIAGVVDDVSSFVSTHPIEALLAVAAGWYYGPRILRAVTGRSRRR